MSNIYYVNKFCLEMESQDTRKSLVRPGSVLEEKQQLKSLLSFWI